MCEGREDYEGLNGAWKDFELARRVAGDRRLKPANLYREIARQMVAPNKLSGRGVGPRVRRVIDEWFAENGHRFPGLELRGAQNAPPIRIGANDLRMLLGYASNFLDHAREVQELGGKVQAHFRKHATNLPRLSAKTEAKLECTDEAWPTIRQRLARRIVARELKIHERTIRRRLEADPHSKGPSIWGWAANYHLHSLNRAAS